MNTDLRLRRLFKNISFAALAAQASSCSDAHSVSRGGFDLTVPCDDAALVAGALHAVDGDYLAIRVGYLPNADDGPPPPVIYGAAGVPCATATDTAACEEAFAALPEDQGWGSDVIFWPERYRSRTHLIWTRGDEVGVITTDEELLAFLGTIHDPEAAALVARFVAGHRIVCDGPNARVVDEGVELVTSTGSACGRDTFRSENILLIAPDGTATVQRSVVVEVGDPNCVIGRLTTGAELPPHARHQALGAYFAEMAALEASAVTAFERLAQELHALGAPAELVRRARDARDDETRHAAQVGALASQYGALPLEIEPPSTLTLRSALDVALENAREGCVRETFGALVATHQAQHARDPRVAEVLGVIAEDETRHAALAWDLAAWLDGVLTPAERVVVHAERTYAQRLFRDGATHALDEAAREAAGLPDTGMARVLFDALSAQLWS
ncbi:MAG: ferritin-like domain-containing protein [Myxococcales bacterium]|nr:ferritin-like domain-containing protein [Myxococcales bacterium]